MVVLTQHFLPLPGVPKPILLQLTDKKSSTKVTTLGYWTRGWHPRISLATLYSREVLLVTMWCSCLLQNAHTSIDLL